MAADTRANISVEFTDTHCHIHFPDYPLNPDVVRESAREAGVSRLICVGCRLEDSRAGVAYAQMRDNTWASIGLHPHEAKHYAQDDDALREFSALAASPKVVAIGECGLDYYYNHSPKAAQHTLLRWQIELALQHNLPLIFHVREAFDDFWSIFDEYEGITGAIHSFSAHKDELMHILARPNLYVGLNGIMTFTNDVRQIEAAKMVPLERLLLETDAPFLTPKPYRGKVCEPKHVQTVAAFLAELRGEDIRDLALVTTKNAQTLFKLV